MGFVHLLCVVAFFGLQFLESFKAVRRKGIRLYRSLHGASRLACVAAIGKPAIQSQRCNIVEYRLDPLFGIDNLDLAMLFALSRGAAGRHLGIHFISIINMILIMLVAPGTALLLGVLPFARRNTRLDAQ